jgi:hypothetical protein
VPTPSSTNPTQGPPKYTENKGEDPAFTARSYTMSDFKGPGKPGGQAQKGGNEHLMQQPGP